MEIFKWVLRIVAIFLVLTVPAAAAVGLGVVNRLVQNPVSTFFSGGSSGDLGTDCGIDPVIADYIKAASKETGVSQAVIAGVIEQESGFRPRIRSYVGAYGLMQTIPPTFNRFKPAGVADVTYTVIHYAEYDEYIADDPSAMYDPQNSIIAGSKYLRFLLDRFNQNLTHTIAAYNAGEGAVDKYNGVPPYTQTQNYVKEVPERIKKFEACLSKPTQQSDFKIYLYWTSGPSDIIEETERYDQYIYSDGSSDHTGQGRRYAAGRTNESRAIAVTAMQAAVSGEQAETLECVQKNILGSGCKVSNPVTDAQLKGLVREAAKLAKLHGIPIDKEHVLTGAEEASLVDFPEETVRRLTIEKGNSAEAAKELGLPHQNLGPFYKTTPEFQQNIEHLDFYDFGDELRRRISAELRRIGGNPAGKQSISSAPLQSTSDANSRAVLSEAKTYTPGTCSGVNCYEHTRQVYDNARMTPVTVGANQGYGNQITVRPQPGWIMDLDIDGNRNTGVDGADHTVLFDHEEIVNGQRVWRFWHADADNNWVYTDGQPGDTTRRGPWLPDSEPRGLPVHMWSPVPISK